MMFIINALISAVPVFLFAPPKVSYQDPALQYGATARNE